jgi:membrane-bound serine protease (ClpP class)
VRSIHLAGLVALAPATPLLLPDLETPGRGIALALGGGIGGGAPVQMVDLTWAVPLLHFLTNPLVVPILLSLGLLGLIFEIKGGHVGVGALVSVVSLGLFFGSNLLLGLAGWQEIILLGLGLIALAVEVFILPGVGVVGLLGLGLITTSMILALIGNSPTTGDLIQAGAVLGASLVITASVFVAWIRHLPNSTRWSGIMLKEASGKAEGFVSAPSRPDLVGKAGEAITDLRPAGAARIAGERVDVVTEGEFILTGSALTVVRSEGYRLVVRATEALAPAETTRQA